MALVNLIFLSRQVGRKLTIDDVKKMDADGRLRRNMDRQIRKDTVNVPDMGITIVRFHATNPGNILI